jgi:hypothetical protein
VTFLGGLATMMMPVSVYLTPVFCVRACAVTVQEILDWIEVTKAKAEIHAFEERLRERRAKIKQRARQAVEVATAVQQAPSSSPSSDISKDSSEQKSA